MLALTAACLPLLPAAARGRYMTAYFACANKTGQHFLLKKYDKRECCRQVIVRQSCGTIVSPLP